MTEAKIEVDRFDQLWVPIYAGERFVGLGRVTHISHELRVEVMTTGIVLFGSFKDFVEFRAGKEEDVWNYYANRKKYA